MRKILTVLLIVFASTAMSFAADFPLRSKYSSVKPITTEELTAKYDQADIVDVRSSVEYDVITINKAQNIPISNKNFLSELEKVRSKNGSNPLVTYCNGVTCAKSYKAVEEAQEAGFKNIFVYDAGIFAWAQAQPEKSTLLGESPVAAEKMISKDRLNSKSVSFAEFQSQAKSGAMVIDIREPFQRAQNPELPQNRLLKMSGVRSVPLDRLVPMLKKGQFKDKSLLIVDAVGKQVRWLQYYLEEYGYSDYAFLKGGVKAAAEAGGVK